MGLEANGHRWEWLEQRCKRCGMLRDEVFRKNLACIDGALTFPG